MDAGRIAIVTRAYRPEIDGLRAIAVSAVAFYHAGFGAFSGGYVGVDIFFVISGFLISGIVYGELRAGTFTILGFYERRARRILPAVFLVLLACWAFAWRLLTPGQLKDFSQSVVGVVGFVANHYFLMKTGYFSPSAEEIPLLHTWTLSVEEQFYLVLPVALLVAVRYRPNWTMGLLAFGFVVSLALCLRWEHRNPALNFFFAPTRAWEFIAGGALALLLAERGGRFALARAVREPLALLGMAGIVFAIVAYDDSTAFPGFSALAPVGGSTLLIAFGDGSTLVGRLLALRPLVGVGLISYSVYLWHQPVLAFFGIANGRESGLGEKLLLLVLIGLLSYLSWRFVEQPFRDKRRVGRRAIVTLSFVGTAAFAALGLAGHLGRGFPARYTEEQDRLAATAIPSPMRSECRTEGVQYLRPEAACRYFEGPASWAVLGDSHVVEIGYALAEALRERGAGSVVHLSASGCQPALDFPSLVPGCNDWLRDSLGFLERHAEIRNVVVGHRHSFYLYGSQLRSYPAVPQEHPNFLPDIDAAEARERYWRSYAALLQRLVAAGKTVYVLEPIPELGRGVEWFVYTRSLAADPAARTRGATLDYHRRRNAFMLSHLDGLPFGERLRRVPVSRAFCDAVQCRVGDGHELYYFDDNHPSVIGARRIAALILGAGPAP